MFNIRKRKTEVKSIDGYKIRHFFATLFIHAKSNEKNDAKDKIKMKTFLSLQVIQEDGCFETNSRSDERLRARAEYRKIHVIAYVYV